MPPRTKTGFAGRRRRKAPDQGNDSGTAPVSTQPVPLNDAGSPPSQAEEQAADTPVPIPDEGPAPDTTGGPAPARRADRVLGLEDIPAPAPPSGPEITPAEQARLELYSDVLEQSKDSRYAVGKVLSGLEAGNFYDRGLGIFRTDVHAELDISSSDADRMMREWPQAEAFQRQKLKIPAASHVRALLPLAEQFSHDAAAAFHVELVKRGEAEGVRVTEQIVRRHVGKFIKLATTDADLAAADARSLSGLDAEGPAEGPGPDGDTTSEEDQASSLTVLVGAKARQLLGDQPLVPEPRSHTGQKDPLHPAVQEAQRLAKLAQELHKGAAALDTAGLDDKEAARAETALAAVRDAVQQTADVLGSGPS